ncbi:MAG: zinc-ribbon and DUF3426 domain-containing protein [Xanthomonadales bacterium]
MYTRCPECATVHPVNAALLAQGGGRYRCAKCNKVSNALEHLFDEWPAAGEKPAGAGDLPVLGLNIDFTKAGRSRLEPAEAALTGAGEPPPERAPRGRLWLRALWITAAIALTVSVVVKLAEFNGTPLIEQADVDAALVRLGLKEPAPVKPFRDLDQIRLVSRQLIRHPTDPRLLRLQATIVNRATRRQPYPQIEVTLFGASGERISSVRFDAKDYLAPGSDRSRGMTPQAYLPLTLDFDDPGDDAVGFEIDFR